MNANVSRIVLRPRGAAEVFDLTFRVVREAWAPTARLTAVVTLPLWLACVVACWLSEGHWAVALPPVVLAGALQAPYTVLVGRIMFADDATVGEVLAQTLRRTPTLLLGALLATLANTLTSLTCFLALPLVQAVFLYLPETTLLEGVDLQRGLKRSQRLAGARFGLALAGALSWWVLTAWAAVVGEATWQGLVETVLQLGTPFGSALTGHVTPGLVGGLILAQPLHAVYRALLYLDARTRSEGWDLQVALRAASLVEAR